MICWLLFFVKHRTAYEMRMSDWSSDVYSSDLVQVQVLELFSADKLGDASSRRFTVEEAAAIARITAANTHKLLSRHHDKVQTEKSGKRVMLTPEQVRQLCGLVQSDRKRVV